MSDSDSSSTSSIEEPITKKPKLEQFQTFLQQTPPTLISKNPLVWIDCEMTGLDIFGDDRIIEICCFITNEKLEIIGGETNFFESTIYYPKSKLDKMNEWCLKTHGESGLIDKILSNPNLTLDKVSQNLLTWLKKNIAEPQSAILAGNTIHMDKFFMMKDFPLVVEFLNYRVLDVSSIMEFGKRQFPQLMEFQPPKQHLHTAKSDILESINQLKWFRDNYFKSSDEIDKQLEKLKEK
ncbi:rex2 [Candida pseudojiufengensis]|uniref:rex2 n=1 Tax=Candida pseudojiufengensis TaxID=497109 RepID=UPI002225AABE|nr:rex2 [Candida pseudojiufengensis]KAI5959854.1 rex2 [Candida pseudojiufengensis]